MSKDRLFSVAPGRLWTPFMDVYWGVECKELFDCKWCIVLPFMAVEWQPGKYEDHELEKKTPSEWEEFFGVKIYDPDGWRLHSPYGTKAWNERITRSEFVRRMNVSTIVR